MKCLLQELRLIFVEEEEEESSCLGVRTSRSYSFAEYERVIDMTSVGSSSTETACVAWPSIARSNQFFAPIPC